MRSEEMAERLIYFYERANQLGGLMARMRLAILTDLPSTQAALSPDSPDLLQRFEAAFQAVQAEFAPTPTEGVRAEAKPLDSQGKGGEQVALTLRRHIQVYLELLGQPHDAHRDLSQVYHQITEASATTLQAHIVGVWLFDAARTAIHCVDQFDMESKKHSSGASLSAQDFRVYFDALRTGRTLAAHNARRDPRTSAFTDSYLIPYNIYALLDVPIWSQGKMIGIICHEQRSAPRLWTSDEENFAFLMSACVAQAYDQSQRVEATRGGAEGVARRSSIGMRPAVCLGGVSALTSGVGLR
jgi:GAF domain-containing protein